MTLEQANKELGQRIMNHRIQRKMTQTDLSRALKAKHKIARSTISRWENGNNPLGMSLTTLSALASIFHIPMASLIRGVTID